MTATCIRCGHVAARHFKGSTVKGRHACLVVGCECRCFESYEVRGSVKKDMPAPKKLTPEQEKRRNEDLL